MKKQKQKQKSNLVFTLYKNADPFMPNSSGQQLIKASIKMALTKPLKKPQKITNINQNLEISQSQDFKQKYRISNLQSNNGVINLAIESMSPQTQRKLRQNKQKQERWKKQLQQRTASMTIKKDIVRLHSTVSKKYYAQDIQTPSYYTSRNPISYSANSKANYSKNNEQQQFNQKMNKVFNKKMRGSEIFGIASAYTRYAQSPTKMETYRHENQKTLQNKIRSNLQYDNRYNNREYNSTINSKQQKVMVQQKIIKSKSELFGMQLRKKYKQPGKYSIKALLNKSKSIRQRQRKAEKTSKNQKTVKIISNKNTFSQKLLRDAHDLDVQVMGSLLLRKIDSNTKFNK